METAHHIWFPYTQMQTARDPIHIVRGKGSYVYADTGKAYLDGISSWWVTIHGHGHPYIAHKISRQAYLLEHVIGPGFIHDPVLQLTQRLIELLPYFSRVFYSDNGSTAVETALKIAFQYWHNQDPLTKRKKVIAMRHAFHGETFGAMSATGKNLFNRPFWDHLFEADLIDPPFQGGEHQSLAQLKKILEKEHSACFIFEPLILGVLGGMKKYSQKGLEALIKCCHEAKVLTIADEVLTGLGRTGPFFASDHLKESPQMMCLAKGLAGGFLPLGATLCTETIFEAFLSEERSKALLHGHSYFANPLCCAAALANLELLEKESCKIARKNIAMSHEKFCKEMEQHPGLNRCESLGTILAIELKTSAVSSYFHSIRDQMESYFLDRGILLRPFGNVIHVIPPYCMTSQELSSIYDAIENFL